MKQKKHLFFVVLWLFLVPQLFAQNGASFSKLKPGDWFEMKVNLSIGVYDPYLVTLKYQLTKQAADGSSSYDITLERVKLKEYHQRFLSVKDIWVGYDSWYPPYQQGNNQSSEKPVYFLETNATGMVKSLKAKKEYGKVPLSIISIKRTIEQGRFIANYVDPLPINLLRSVSELITEAIAENKTAIFNGKMLKPGKIPDYNTCLFLNAASFPLTGNTLIKGFIRNRSDQLKNSNQIYINDQIIKINPDGSFNAPVFLSGTSAVSMIYGYYPDLTGLNVLLTPGDTLTLDADAKDMLQSVKFYGKKSGDAGLRKILDKNYIGQTIGNSSGYEHMTPVEFLAFQAKGKVQFRQVMDQYKEKTSAAAQDYYTTEFMYLQAEAKLGYLQFNNYLSSPKSIMAFVDFPKDFFLSIDTVPVLMNAYEDNIWYQNYLKAFIAYQQIKMSMTNGNQSGFLASYVTSMATLKGYPLYYALSRTFQDELMIINWKDSQKLKPYYDDFIGNCGDSTLTMPVKRLWDNVQLWVPGKPSPVRELILTDGTKLNLEKFKGKALCLIINYDSESTIHSYLQAIKKQDPSKTHFVIAQLVSDATPKGDLAAIFKKFTNVTYVELSGAKQQKDISIPLFVTKTFFFDSDLRIIDDNITHLPDGINGLDDYIKKAIDGKKMSDEDKAILINKIGWSAGSILFTLTCVFGIYKIRIASIRKREAVKRQIKELEIKAIRSQMNPHFIFNALNSIQSLINNHQYKEANVYLEKFSVLMRRVLNNSGKSLVPLSDELEAVTLYCVLEKLRFDFKFSLHIEPEVNTSLIEIPGMIIQPLVENAILHALAQMGTEGSLTINVTMEGICLKIYVTDNGPGIQGGTDGLYHVKGFGLKLVRERLGFLNSGNHTGKLTINSILEGTNKGTSAILTLPID